MQSHRVHRLGRNKRRKAECAEGAGTKFAEKKRLASTPRPESEEERLRLAVGVPTDVFLLAVCVLLGREGGGEGS